MGKKRIIYKKGNSKFDKAYKKSKSSDENEENIENIKTNTNINENNSINDKNKESDDKNYKINKDEKSNNDIQPENQIKYINDHNSNTNETFIKDSKTGTENGKDLMTNQPNNDSPKNVESYFSQFIKYIYTKTGNTIGYCRKVMMSNIITPLLGLVGKHGLKLLLIKLSTSSKKEFIALTVCSSVFGNLGKNICLAGIVGQGYYRKREKIKLIAAALLCYLQNIGFI